MFGRFLLEKYPFWFKHFFGFLRGRGNLGFFVLSSLDFGISKDVPSCKLSDFSVDVEHFLQKCAKGFWYILSISRRI